MTAVFVALTLAVMGAFLALTINVGHLFTVRHDLHNGADSGALAGALDLDGTPGPLQTAIDSAGAFAAQHTTDGQVNVYADPVELGHWTPPSETCQSGEVATGTTGPNGYQFCRVSARNAAAALRINAVRVVTSRVGGESDPSGGAAPVFMNGLLGAASTASVRTEAVAVAGGPSESDCVPAPFVIRVECLQGPGSIQCCDPAAPACPSQSRFFLGLGSTPVNTAGWTLFTTSTPNTSGLCDYLRNPPTNCSIQVGSTIGTANGNNISPSCPGGGGGPPPTICELLRGYVGGSFKVPMVEYGDGGGCLGAPYSGSAVVEGFATLTVTQVYCHDPGEPAPAAGTPCAPYATGQCIAVTNMCVDDNQDPGGGAWSGTAARPRLVR